MIRLDRWVVATRFPVQFHPLDINPPQAQGIAAEDKVAVIKRLGRSPDKQDALVMAWHRGVTGGYQRRLYGASEAVSPYKVVRAYEQRKRRFRR